jgi:heterodisulfide reductase subunit B
MQQQRRLDSYLARTEALFLKIRKEASLMRYSFFEGCKIPFFLKQYGTSALALLHKFDIEIIETEFNCCGYPIRDINFPAFLLSGARNLALAEQKGTPIVTPCKCCYGTLKFVEHYLRHDNNIKDQINKMLRQEGLQWEGRIEVRHLLTVLHEDIGLEALRASVRHSLRGIRVAAHTGCHALRPGNVTQFDNPLVPTFLNDLVAVTGAESIFWPMSTECCGNPQWDKNQKLALKQTQRKLVNARQAGADYVCTACTYCQMQFEQKQLASVTGNSDHVIPSVLISQLIGLSVGLSDAETGITAENRQGLTAHAGYQPE